MTEECKVDPGCENPVRHRYTWAWGEEGFCCESHRSTLESKSAQLGRGISFSSGVQAYSAPTLSQIPPDTGKLKIRIVELQADLKAAQQAIADRDVKIKEIATELETTRMTVLEREEQLQNLSRAAEVPSEVIIEGGDVEPATPSTHGSRGKRSR